MKTYLDTYSSFWDIEPTIYSIVGYRLPFAIVLTEFIYFGFGFLVVWALAEIPGIQLITKLPGLKEPFVYYLVLPFIMMKFLGKQKVNGKKPYHFFMDTLVWICSPKEYEHFSAVKRPRNQTLNYVIPARHYELVSIFELKKKKGEKKDEKVYLIHENT